ncbi:MAG: hypothetical protein ABDI20_08630 [Candidatus Bipolaricaulaceae bacterium]
MIVTLEEFRESRYWRDNMDEAQVEEALRYAEERFYALTNRAKYGYWLEPKVEEFALDGTGTRLLRAPSPVLEVLEVQVLTETGPLPITENVRPRGHFLYRLDGVFPEGVGNVRVKAKVGDPLYARRGIPEDAKEAVRRLAFLKLLRHVRIAGEQLDEHRPPTEPPPPPTLTGDREVDGILKTYYLTPPLGYLDLRGPVEEA